MNELVKEFINELVSKGETELIIGANELASK